MAKLALAYFAATAALMAVALHPAFALGIVLALAWWRGGKPMLIRLLVAAKGALGVAVAGAAAAYGVASASAGHSVSLASIASTVSAVGGAAGVLHAAGKWAHDEYVKLSSAAHKDIAALKADVAALKAAAGIK